MSNQPDDSAVARVEVYSMFLRVQGSMDIRPPLRLSDEVNRLEDYLHLRDTVTEPLLSSYPVVSTREAETSVAKAAVVMITAEGGPPQHNPQMWHQKILHTLVLNTTAFSLAAEVHLEPRLSLATHLQRNPREFLPLTRVSAVVVASLAAGGADKPQTFQRDFALINPASIVSFSVRPAEATAEGQAST